MKIHKFEVTSKGDYKIKYESDEGVEISAIYEDNPPDEVLILLAKAKYLFTRIMRFDDYRLIDLVAGASLLADRVVIVGINVKERDGTTEYEIIGSLVTPGYDKDRRITSYPLRPGTPILNELTGELYRDVDIDNWPHMMNDDDVFLVESLITGVVGFVRGDFAPKELELFSEGEKKC